MDRALLTSKIIPKALLSTVNKSYLEEAVASINIAKTMNECLWVGDKNHKTLYVNPMFEKLSEYTLAECVGKDCVSFFDKKGQKIINEHHQLRKKGLSSQYEATMVSKNGKKIPLLISGAPTKNGTIGIFTNLTSLKQLSQREKLSEQIIKYTSDAIVVLDKDHRVILWNNGAEKTYGYTEKEMLGKPLNYLVPRGEEKTFEEIDEVIEEKKVIRFFEAKRKAKDGTILDVLISMAKVEDEEGNFIGYLVFYDNITEQKQASEELQKRFEVIQDAYKELGVQNRQMDYFKEIIETATSPALINSLEQLIVNSICMVTRCDGAILRALKKDKLKFLASCGVEGKWTSKDQNEYPGSLAEEAAKIGRPLIINRIDATSKHQGLKLLKEHHFKTFIMIPLIVLGKMIGSLSLYAKESKNLRFIETDFLEIFGKECALALYAKIHEDKKLKKLLA